MKASKFELYSEKHIPPKGTVVEINDFGKYDKKETSTGGFVYIRSKEGVKFLFLTRDDGRLTLPKGHVEDSEKLKEAALRQICEETGVDRKKLGWFITTQR